MRQLLDIDGTPFMYSEMEVEYLNINRQEIVWKLPKKSTMSRPSQYLPEGLPKKVIPLGKGTRPNAADTAPVSEFESPKLKIAGKWQSFDCLRSNLVSLEKNVSAATTMNPTPTSAALFLCSLHGNPNLLNPTLTHSIYVQPTSIKFWSQITPSYKAIRSPGPFLSFILFKRP